MNIGKLDRLLLLQAPAAVAQDSFGQPVGTPGFTDVATVYGQPIYPRPGTETVQTAQLTAEQTVQFTIRYRADVRPTWQVVYEGTIYLITAVAEIGRRQGLTLTTQRRG